MVLAGGGLDLNNIALYRRGANSPPEAPERGCTDHSAGGSTVYADPTFSPRGNARLIACGAVDPDWGPR